MLFKEYIYTCGILLSHLKNESFIFYRNTDGIGLTKEMDFTKKTYLIFSVICKEPGT